MHLDEIIGQAKERGAFMLGWSNQNFPMRVSCAIGTELMHTWHPIAELDEEQAAQLNHQLSTRWPAERTIELGGWPTDIRESNPAWTCTHLPGCLSITMQELPLNH